MKINLKAGDLIKSKFDGRKHKVLKVLKSKIYWSENEDGTGEKHSGAQSVVLECFHVETQKPIISEKPEKPLYLVLQSVYFNDILKGRKNEEYRECSPFYESRFFNKKGEFRNYKTVIFQEGYHSGARRMTCEIKKITKNGVFTIHLGEILERNF